MSEKLNLVMMMNNFQIITEIRDDLIKFGHSDFKIIPYLTDSINRYEECLLSMKIEDLKGFDLWEK